MSTPNCQFPTPNWLFGAWSEMRRSEHIGLLAPGYFEPPFWELGVGSWELTRRFPTWRLGEAEKELGDQCDRNCFNCPVLIVLTAPALGAQNPQFDLLIRNGHVIDPRNGIDAVMDVAVSAGKIARVAAKIDPHSRGASSTPSGLYVVPGLIDIHAHVFFGTEKDAYLSNGDIGGSARQPLVPQRPDDARRCRRRGMAKFSAVQRAGDRSRAHARAVIHQHRRVRDEGRAD